MKTTTQQDYEERILRVLVHIQTRLNHALDLEDLALVAHFSPCHFHRVFKGMVGEPVMEHVRRLRLERAAYQLKTGDRPVTQVAFDAGYETHEAFTRAFRAMFDAPPSQFRQERHGAGLAQAPSGVHYGPDGPVGEFQPLQADIESVQVRIEDAPPMRTAFMRHVGPYDEVGATWQKFMAWAGPRGLFGPTARILAAVHDDPEITSPDKLRYDVCISVGDHFEAQGEVGAQDIPGGEYAVATHRGPYQGLGHTYAVLMGQWLPAHSREPTQSPCLEAYLNNPQMTPPEDLLTEVRVPLRPADRTAGATGSLGADTHG